jgi:hypothetical protein
VAVDAGGPGPEDLRSAVSSALAELAERFERRKGETSVSFTNSDPTLRAGTVRFGVRRFSASLWPKWVLDVEVVSAEGSSLETDQALGRRRAMLATLRHYASDPTDVVTTLRELALSLYRSEYTGAEQREGAVSAAVESDKWKLLGYDTFANEWYGLGGEFHDEESARKAARRRLRELERSQPSSSSGGQDGIQDRVYIVAPDGTSSRVV